MDKKQSHKSGRLSAAEQQQLAMLQQLGALDPSLLGYAMPSAMDPAQLLNPMAAAGYSMVNPAALQAFAGLGGRTTNQSMPGNADWWNLMQNPALAASLGTGYLPGMLPGFLPPTVTKHGSKSSSSGNSKVKDEPKRGYEKMSPRPESSSPSISRLQQERKASHESHSSKERPDSHHSTNSPHHPSTSKHNDSNKSLTSSWMDVNQKTNEQAFQMELLRQFEQQIMLQQFQIQQQQQQQQLNAALESMMGLQAKTSSSRRKGGDGQKGQDQLTAMMAQMMHAGGMQGMTPAMTSLLSQPGALETMLAMSQMGNMNHMASFATPMRLDNEDGRDKSTSSSSRNSTMHSPQNNQIFSSSVSPSIIKKRDRSSSPRKITPQSESTSKTSSLSIPGLSPTLAAGLSPDNAMLAMLYSQQLQCEEFIKQQLAAGNKMPDSTKLPGDSNKHEQAHSSNQYQNSVGDSSLFNNRSNLHSPANSTSSRGKSHVSPSRETAKSPSKKSSKDPEGSTSRGSSKYQGPTSKQATSSKQYEQENMSETLKLFSALASNPNLTQQELTALLSFPATADPSALYASLGPSAAMLLHPSLASGRMNQAELEKLNKNLATALEFEKRRLEDQMKSQLENETRKEKSSNHISVIHNNMKRSDSVERPSSSNSINVKKLSNDIKDIPKQLSQGDAVSSDGDVKSEASVVDRNSYGGNKSTRPRIPINDEVLAPLKSGWKREIRFKPFGNQLRGEVVYTTPDKRKLRMYADVMKYLEDNEIKDLTRNNFSFSTRLRLGTLLERKDRENGAREWVEITEEDLESQSQLQDRGQTSSPFADSSDKMSSYSSSSRGESKLHKKDQERERQKEQFRVMKEQEELRRLEQQRIEREIRERLALEELERQRIAEDQRRQHMILMRALESRKRAEERERRREELRIEKMLQREKKMEQRRIAMQIARELKMPVEDMSAIGAPELPDMTRLQGTYDNNCPHQLSGNACADLLMVLEFVKTFKECLRFDDSVTLSFTQLQLALLNDPKHTPSLVQLTIALLHQCLCDPGVPAPGPWLHCLTGVKVTDIDVSEDNYSEILRLFIWARSGYKTEIAVKLETLPFLSLSADEKATSLAFLVNELVCSRPICMEIEKNLDTIATLKRDKWIVEGQMRQLRIAYEKNPAAEPGAIEDENSSSSLSAKPNATNSAESDCVEDNSETIFQKKMEELSQQHTSYNTQLAHNSKPLRALDLGQDRYKRRYWVLPNLGGVYVEGLESGISYEDDDESPDEDEEDDEEEDTKKVKTEEGQEPLQGNATENVNTEDKKLSGTDSEPMEATVSPHSGSSSVIQNGDSSVSKAKCLEDPTESSKDIAKVLMLLSQEPIKHDANKTKNVSAEQNTLTTSSSIDDQTSESGSKNASNSIDEVNEKKALNQNLPKDGVVTNGTTEKDISTLFHTNSPHKINCSDTAPIPSEQSGKESPVMPGATNSIKNLNSSSNQTITSNHHVEDSVVAAAKAIAAKAVASTSHLLFPKNGSSPKSQSKIESTQETPNDQKSVVPDVVDNSTLPIGEHTRNALVQMGVNPTLLTSEQLEVLSHLGIPMSVSNDKSKDAVLSYKKLSDTRESQPSEERETRDSNDNTVTKEEKDSEEQDTPMDLSQAPTSTSFSTSTVAMTTSTSTTTNGSVKSIEVKLEPSPQKDSPYAPAQDSPNPKLADNKFFIPISLANSNHNDVKTEQQQYNQMIYSCPSPNTLANFIISSANYGQLPPLDDIKFPIRPPDVKEEPDSIPRERKRGWWRIESESELRSLSEKLHLRGIREKQLHKNITKNFEICTSSMADSMKPEHKFTVLTKDSVVKDESSATEKTDDVGAVKKSARNVNSEEKKVEDIPSRFVTSNNLAFQAEIQVLNQVEDLAARCLNMAVVSPQWRTDDLKPSITRKDLTHVPLGPLRDEFGVEIKFDITNPIHHDAHSALGVAVELIASLERAVCRRYLKPPLVRKGGASEFSSLPSLSESGALDVAAGLRTWRNAVVSSASASQLALCVRMLESCIAWDRSAHHAQATEDTVLPTKTKKRKSDKRPVPKTPVVPDSPPPKKKRKKKATPAKTTPSPSKGQKARRMPIDTADVISKLYPNKGESKEQYTNGNMDEDSHGADASAADTFEDSYTSAADDSMTSVDGQPTFPTKSSPEIDSLGSPSALYLTNSDNMSDEYRPSSEPKKKKKKKKKGKPDATDEISSKKPNKQKKRGDKDSVVCRALLKELQSHEDATWFLFPVDCKLVPGYRKIIKKPIDFHTIESRLKRGRYKSKEEFVSEVRLVFDNCQKFNEDDSNIGRAGHKIRNFFEKRWAEILEEKYGISHAESKSMDSYPVVQEDSNTAFDDGDPSMPDQFASQLSYQDSESFKLSVDES